MKKLSFIIMIMLLAASAQAQMKLGGITLPATLPAGKEQLLLNGGGVREKYFMDMYVGGLYLLQKSQDENKIMSADELMGVRLQIVSGMITSDKMVEAVNEGFKNSTNGNTAPIQPKISRFIGVFQEKIAEGDIYDLIYIPSKGVAIFKNGKLKETIEGLEFKKALFGIWLSSRPADTDLKKGMLGK
jgi:hypothetical protein